MAENIVLLLFAALAAGYGLLDSRRPDDLAIFGEHDVVRFRSLRSIRWPCIMTGPAMVYGSASAFATGDLRTSAMLLALSICALLLPTEIAATPIALELRFVWCLAWCRIPLASIAEALVVPGDNVVEVTSTSGQVIRHTSRHVDRQGFVDALRRRGVKVLEQGPE